jgi:DNA-binding GntR family transcriptional regulator
VTESAGRDSAPHSPTIAARLYETLAEEIITGTLVPGQRLEERELAERFEVSRTPIREALRGLQERGLVEIMPRRGIVVATISIERLQTLLEAQCELEALCARRASEAMTSMERQELELLHAQSAEQAKREDHVGYLETNRQFHSLIARGTHNDMLISMLGDLRERLAPFRQAQSDVERRLEVAQREHDAVVRAVVDGKPEAAFVAMRNHDARLSTNVLRIIRNREALLV